MSNGTAPLTWDSRIDLGAAAPAHTRLELGLYDWWHFRRLGAHAPELAQLLQKSPSLVPIVFDLYGLLYKPSPTRRPGAHTALADALADELERTGALTSLRSRTVLDEWATVTALPALVAPLLEAIAGTASTDDAVAEACTRAVGRVAELMQSVDEVERLFRENDGWGRNRGALASIPLAELVRLGRMIARDRTLKQILDLAGHWTFTLKRRFPRGASARGRAEVRTVELGGDISMLLPSELALLREPRLRRVVLAKVIERRALVTAMHGPKSLGRGPVIVVVDTSASMGVDRLKLAKSFCLALAMRCWETARPLHVVTFGAPGEIVETTFPSREDFMPRLRGCLSLAFGGGTDYDGPLGRVCDLSSEKPWSQADAIVITDGHGKASPEIKARLARMRRRANLEIIGVLVGNGPGLEEVADEIYEVDERRLVGRTETEPELKLFERVALRL